MGKLLNYIEISLALRSTKAVVTYALKGVSFDSKEQLLAIVNLEAEQNRIKQQEADIHIKNQ